MQTPSNDKLGMCTKCVKFAQFKKRGADYRGQMSLAIMVSPICYESPMSALKVRMEKVMNCQIKTQHEGWAFNNTSDC